MTVRTLYSGTLALRTLPDARIGKRPIHPRGIRCSGFWRRRHRQRRKPIECRMQNVIVMEPDAFPIRIVDHLSAGRTSIEVFRRWGRGPVAFPRFQKIGRKACKPVAIGRNKARRARTERTGWAGPTMEWWIGEVFVLAARLPS